MGFWSQLFVDETAFWTSPYNAQSTLAVVQRGFPRLMFSTQNYGTILQIRPRNNRIGGVTVYTAEVEATNVPGGSQIRTNVRLRTRTIVRYATAFATVAVVGLVLVAAGVGVSIPLVGSANLVVYGVLGTFVFTGQTLLMGRVRKGVSKRLARALAAAGAAPVPAPPSRTSET